MGFPRARVARAVEKLGLDDKKVMSDVNISKPTCRYTRDQDMCVNSNLFIRGIQVLYRIQLYCLSKIQ